MSKRFRKTIAALALVCAAFAAAPDAFAQDSTSCEAEIQAIENELDALERDAFAEIEKAQEAADDCVAELAGEQALRAGLQADLADVEKALARERELRIRTEERAPSRLTWFLIGAGTGVGATVAVVLVVAL